MSFIVKITETDGEITINLLDFESNYKCTIRNDEIQKGEVGSTGWMAVKILEHSKEIFKEIMDEINEEKS